MTKKGEKNPLLYELDGPEALGSTLRIVHCSDNAPEISQCEVQWYRVLSESGKKKVISGISYLHHISCVVDYVPAAHCSRLSSGWSN